VLLLSKDFIRKQYPMEELQLLLRWREQGSKAKLLPVFYDLSIEELLACVADYKKGASDDTTQQQQQRRQQWVTDLEELAGITGFRKEQVGHCWMESNSLVPQFVPVPRPPYGVGGLRT
jgi:hypothetical protein